MDKNEAVRISKEYLKRVRNANLRFTEAWLFGSYAKGNQHIDSDIDIAIVLNDDEKHSFDTDVMLMVIRKGEETMIEPHAFSRDEFNRNLPIVDQIMKYGIKIDI